MVLSICKDKGRRLRICDLWLKYPRKGYKIEIMKGMFPMNMFKKNGGFTLVELIVVIAILAILAGIEENFLEKYYCIPVCTTTVCSMLSYKTNNYTDNYSALHRLSLLQISCEPC